MMKEFAIYLIGMIFAFTSFTGRAVAQDIAKAPVGYNRIACLPGSDTVVSASVMKEPVPYEGVVASSAAGSGSQATLTPQGTPNWTAGAFTSVPHYVRFLSGAKAGMWYDIAANNTGTLTIDLDGDAASDIGAGDQFLIVQHWTLNTLLPPATQTAVIVSPGTLPRLRKSTLLFPTTSATVGIDQPAGMRYFLLASGWVKDAPDFPAAGQTIIPPGLTFIIRNPVGATGTTFVAVGRVLTEKDTIALNTSQVGPLDNNVAPMRPVAMRLQDLGFTDSSFMPSVSHQAGGVRDQLLVFDNASPGVNKPPSAVYYRLGDNWYKNVGAGSGNPVANTDAAWQPATGLIIRKYSGTGFTDFWTNEAGY